MAGLTKFKLLIINKFFYSICAPQSITYAFLGEYHSVKNRARVLLIGKDLLSFLYAMQAQKYYLQHPSSMDSSV